MIARLFVLRRHSFVIVSVATVLMAAPAAIAQLAAPAERYPAAGSAAAPAANASGSVGNAPPAGSQVAPVRSPMGAAAPSATGGTGGNLGALPNATGGNPYGQGSPSSGAASRSLPLSGASSQPMSGSNQPLAAPPGYQAAPPANMSGNAQASGSMTPSGMMRAMMNPPAGSRLQGRPMSLQEVVAGAQNRGDQTARVEAYWDLCSSIADYYLGLREAEELQRLRSLVQRVGATWSQAESELNIRVGTSQRAAYASQLRLASLIGRSSNDLPLPADTPHCASYDTQFDRIFPNGAPAEARELAAVLPARYAELKNAKSAVERCNQLVETVARRDSDGTETLRTLELLALQRRAFVQIARDYNRRIARYSELASPGQLSPVRLTAMLIYTSASATDIPPYKAPPRNQQSNVSPSPPRTFAEGTSPAIKPITGTPVNTDGVQPASLEQSPLGRPAEVGDEKSLLVAPLKP